MNRATEHKEKVAQANLIAQKQSIAGQLQQVNESLSFALQELDSVLANIDEARSQLATALDEREEALRINRIIQMREESKEKRFALREEALDERERQLVEAERLSVAKLEQQTAKSLVLEDALKAYTTEIEQVTKEKDFALDALHARNQTVRELDSQINDLTDKLITEQLKRQEVLNELDKQILAKREELHQTSIKVEEELAKIEKPLQVLYEGKRELDKERRDLDIYNARVRARFRMMFPDKSMPI